MNTKPGLDQLLIQSALNPDLQRRLRESPDVVFRDFDLSGEEQEVLRRPDHRLLPLLGAALARQSEVQPAVAPETPAMQLLGVEHAKPLSDLSLALTVVPCAQHENGEFKGFRYAAWVAALPPGTDPAQLPLPEGTVLPGTPCPPLRAVITVSAVQLQDAEGNLQAGLWASLRQASNVLAAAPVETAGRPDASPFGSNFDSPAVREAADAVRSATPAERYDRILSLMGVLRTGEVV